MSKKKKKVEVVADSPERAETPDRSGWLWIGVPIAVLLTVGLFAGGVFLRLNRAKPPIHLAPEEMKPLAASTPEPAPWTYDSVTDQHWDPDHKHWHRGHPPNQLPGGGPAKPVPNIPNPEPWQYDAATDQHWNPEAGHQHWHTGKPPADKMSPSSPVTIPAPTPEPITTQEAAEVPPPVEVPPAAAP